MINTLLNSRPSDSKSIALSWRFLREFDASGDESDKYVGERASLYTLDTPYRAVRVNLKLGRTIADLAGSEEIQSARLVGSTTIPPQVNDGIN